MVRSRGGALMGEVFKRSKGGKVLGYYLRWYEGGKRRVMASKQGTHAEARSMLQAIEGRVARGLVGLDAPARTAPADKLSVAELCERFLTEYSRPRIKDLADYRQQARSCLRRALAVIGERKAATTKQNDITKLRDALCTKFSQGSVGATISALATVYSWAVREGLVQTNPCRGVERPKARTLLEYLSKEDVKRLLTHTAKHRPKVHPMLATALHLGLRKGELFGLRWRDLDLETRRLDIMRSYRTLPKGSKPRHLRIPTVLVPILREWQRHCPNTPEALVFPVCYRTPRMGKVKDMLGIEELLQGAGCPRMERPWHAMRHTFASHFVMSGGSILALQKILGHSDLKMTLIYAHLAPDYLEGELERVRY